MSRVQVPPPEPAMTGLSRPPLLHNPLYSTVRLLGGCSSSVLSESVRSVSYALRTGGSLYSDVHRFVPRSCFLPVRWTTPRATWTPHTQTRDQLRSKDCHGPLFVMKRWHAVRPRSTTSVGELCLYTPRTRELQRSTSDTDSYRSSRTQTTCTC